MGGVITSVRNGATSLWITGGSLVHQEEIHGQRQQTVIPLEQIGGVEVEPAPDPRWLAGAALAAVLGIAGLIVLHWLVAPVAGLASVGLLATYDLTRGTQLTVQAPSGTVRVHAHRRRERDQLVLFARQLRAAWQGATAYRQHPQRPPTPDAGPPVQLDR